MQAHDFPYPLSLSALGVLTSAIFSRGAVAIGLAAVRPESVQFGDFGWAGVALPVGACKAATLAAGNAVYLHLGLGFIQMLKAFTPAVVLAVMVACGLRHPSRPAIFFVAVIIVGTMLEVRGELHASAVGLALILFSELMEAVNLVLTQRLLQDCKLTAMEGLYILAPPSAFCLLAAAAALEWPAIREQGHLEVVRQHPLDFAAAAVLGLAVNFVTMSLVRATSSLFTKILNTLRCVCLVLVGVALYGEVISSTELAGYCIALVGFAGYNYVQFFPERGAHLERLLDVTFGHGPDRPRKLRTSLDEPADEPEPAMVLA